MRRILCGLLLTTIGCGGKDADTAADTGAAAAAGGSGGASAALGGGSVTGTVSFTGTAPANKTIDMSEEAACASKYSGGAVDSALIVSGGKVKGVVVYVKSGLPAGQTYPVPANAVVLDQEACQYKPRAFAAMVGQKVDIKNSDPVLHNVKAVPTKNRGFNISQPTQGMTTSRTFTTEEEKVPLQCNVHSWMQAEATILPHPFFAVSGDDGSFTISGLPAGTYTIEARHPSLGVKTAEVTVPATGAGTAAFTFGPTTS
jgi:plastocyanin